MKIFINYNYIKIIINTNNFDNIDLQIITNVDKKFTIKNEVNINGNKIIQKHQNYKSIIIDKHTGDRIIKLPKYEGIKYLKTLKLESKMVDLRSLITTEPLPENSLQSQFISSIILQDKQKKICNYLENKLKTRITHNMVFIAKPGSGKTIISIELLTRIRQKTIIILPNLYLLCQWKEAIIEYTNIKLEEILIWNGTNKHNLEYYNPNFKIILTTVHTSVKIKNKSLIEAGVRFTIYDEIHLYTSKTFSRTFWKTQTYYNLGITGTSKLVNGFEKVFIQHLNELTFSKNIVPDDEIKFSVKVKIIKNRTKYENVLNEDGVLVYANTLTNIIIDNARNKIIVSEILRIYDMSDNSYCFVFSDRLNHLATLKSIIEEVRDDIIVMTGGSSDEIIEYANEKARVILTTFSYSSTGVNIPKMTSLIFASPRKNNINQILGRVLRRGNEEQNQKLREIVDIVDINSICYNSSRERMKNYIEEGYTLEFNDLKNS